MQGAYSPLITETIDRYHAGQPVLYFTWTPNWTVGELEPGREVIWLETPFPSLPADQIAFLDRTAIAGIPGCANDPCQVGWPPNDIRVVANSGFLENKPFDSEAAGTSGHSPPRHLRPERADGCR